MYETYEQALWVNIGPESLACLHKDEWSYIHVWVGAKSGNDLRQRPHIDRLAALLVQNKGDSIDEEGVIAIIGGRHF